MSFFLTLFSTILFYLAYAADVAVMAQYTVHMLQLNAYRPERYAGWLRQNRAAAVSKAGWLLLCTVAVGCLLTAQTTWTVRTACATLFFLHAYLHRPRQAKKPLVYTHRVWRLFFTLGLLSAAAGAAAGLTGMRRLGLGLLYLWSALTPFWVLLANFLNTPVEKAVAARYTRDAKRILASRPDLIVIGITGSYGKTSTKTFLHALLSAKYNVLMTPESYNTPMGVVRTVRERLLPSHEVFLVEMGAKNPGDIRELCELVHPRYGVLTSIGEQHLETFKTVDSIIRTKFELADAIPPDGCIFLNFDNRFIRSRPVAVPHVSYGAGADTRADYHAADITVGREGSAFTVTAPSGESRRFSTRLLGAHAIQNITGCIAAAHTLGVPLDDLVVPVRRLKPVEHRLQLLPNGFIDDAYNANPAGFRAALDVLKSFEGQRVLVTPGMVELGERQEALNRELGAYAAGCCDYAVLVGQKQAPPLRQGLLEAGFPEERIRVASTLGEGLVFVQGLPGGERRTVLLENDLPDNF